MGLLSRFRSGMDVEKLFETFFGENERWKEKERSVSILGKLIMAIRPKKWKSGDEADLSQLIALLQENDIYLKNFKAYLTSVIKGGRFDKVLTDAGIIRDVSFFYELKQRIVAKFIPHQPDPENLEFLLTQAFYVDKKIGWIETVPTAQLIRLYELLHFEYKKKDYETLKVRNQVLFSIEVLANKIAGLATEPEVNKMVPEYSVYETPFLGFQRELQVFFSKYREDDLHYVSEDDIDYRQLMVLHEQCVEFIEKAYRNTQKFGISIRVNQYLLRIQQQLQRLKDLLQFLILNKGETKNTKFIDLVKYLIHVNYQKNNISGLLDKSTHRVAQEITQHKAKSGEHYITASKSEYKKMLHASLGGGGIVGLMCVTKLLLSKLDVSPFGSAFLYSMNYAIGFIIIYLLGYTLATKQPAMTASTFVKSLVEDNRNKKKKHRYSGFAILFARLFRSQFIAFVGNVAMAFPVALIGIWIIDLLWGSNIAAEKGGKMLKDINPTTSLAILHASIAGIYLFLSGVIAGNISNRIKHNRIIFRLQEHPVLKILIGRKRAAKLAAFHGKKYPGVMSNFWFGVFMGSTAMIGYILGLNLDIRHITFASGNFALGLYGSEWSTIFNMLVWVIIGIGIIGFMNFIVSFTLSIIVAMRSCKIPISELRFIFKAVLIHFVNKPTHFFFPHEEDHTEPKRIQTEESDRFD